MVKLRFTIWLIRRFTGAGRGRVAGKLILRGVNLVLQAVHRGLFEEIPDLDVMVYAVMKNLPVLLGGELHSRPLHFAVLVSFIGHAH